MRSVLRRGARLMANFDPVARYVFLGAIGDSESRYAVLAARPGKWNPADVRSEDTSAWRRLPDRAASTGNRV